MYEKCATTFGVFGLGRVHFAKFSPPHLRFPTLSLIREMLSTEPSVCGEVLSLYVFYILFFVFLYSGVFTGIFTYLEHSMHVVYWPGTVLVVFGV